MIILCDPFPSTVCVGEESYCINTDFREWIRFCEMMQDATLTARERLESAMLWYTGDAPTDLPAAMHALCAFLAPECLRVNSRGRASSESSRQVLSYAQDAPYILADFLHYYGIDIKSVPALHWWHFRLLLMGLPEDSGTKKRMAYRAADLRDIDNPRERDRIRRIQCEIAIEQSCNDYDIGSAFT